MGVGSIGGRIFRLDPVEIRWSYQVKVADLKTVGGKVVQVYGADIGDLTVVGAFGVGGWQEQTRFLSEMKKIGDTQVANALSASAADPVSFVYPPRDWNFLVYLKAFTDLAGSTSMVAENTNFNPKWMLTLQVADDGDGALKTVAMDSFISRLTEGMGWRRTDYNGPLLPNEKDPVQGPPLPTP